MKHIALLIGFCLPCTTSAAFERLSEKQQTFLSTAFAALVQEVDPQLNIGIEVVSLATGQTWYKKDEHRRFVPASLLKLVTATTVMLQRGLEHTFLTSFFASGTLEKEKHRLKGDLILKAGGDPTLTTTDIGQMVAELKQYGITKITGDFVLDTTIFDTVAKGPGWAWDDPDVFWNVPVTGLVVDHNCSEQKSEGQTTTSQVVIKDVPNHIFMLVQKLFAAEGIKLCGSYKEGVAPRDATLMVFHTSPPLRQILAVMLKQSDNLYADMLFKYCSPDIAQQCSWSAAATEVTAFLTKFVPQSVEGVRIVDGCGMSRYNLVTPHTLLQLLLWHGQQSTFKEFLKLLPTPNSEGTLKTRMPELQKKLRAKTGSMLGVSGLAGYLLTDEGEPLAFVIMINNYTGPSTRYKELEDSICRLLTNPEKWTLA